MMSKLPHAIGDLTISTTQNSAIWCFRDWERFSGCMAHGSSPTEVTKIAIFHAHHITSHRNRKSIDNCVYRRSSQFTMRMILRCCCCYSKNYVYICICGRRPKATGNYQRRMYIISRCIASTIKATTAEVTAVTPSIFKVILEIRCCCYTSNNLYDGGGRNQYIGDGKLWHTKSADENPSSNNHGWPSESR